MPARFPDTPPLAALLTLATVLTACAPANLSRNERSSEASTSAESSNTSSRGFYQPQLLDPERQIYRHRSGVCRELGNLPPPWRVYESKRYETPGRRGHRPAGYDWGPMLGWGTDETFEAEYAQLGVKASDAMPSNFQRFGLAGNVALLALGQPLKGREAFLDMLMVQAALLGARQPDWQPPQPIPFKTPGGEPRLFVPRTAPFPVSASFSGYVEGPDYVSDRSDLVLINPALQAGISCNHRYNWPNGSCKGVILLEDGEVARIRVSFEALGTLQEVVESMIHAARSIRVDCPVEGGGA